MYKRQLIDGIFITHQLTIVLIKDSRCKQERELLDKAVTNKLSFKWVKKTIAKLVARVRRQDNRKDIRHGIYRSELIRTHSRLPSERAQPCSIADTNARPHKKTGESERARDSYRQAKLSNKKAPIIKTNRKWARFTRKQEGIRMKVIRMQYKATKEGILSLIHI